MIVFSDEFVDLKTASWMVETVLSLTVCCSTDFLGLVNNLPGWNNLLFNYNWGIMLNSSSQLKTETNKKQGNC